MTDRYFVQLEFGGWRDIDDVADPKLNSPTEGFKTAEAAFAVLRARVARYGIHPDDYRVVARQTTTTDTVVEPPLADPGVLGAHVTDRDGDLWARGNGDAWVCLDFFHGAPRDVRTPVESWQTLNDHFAPLVEVHGPISSS